MTLPRTVVLLALPAVLLGALSTDTPGQGWLLALLCGLLVAGQLAWQQRWLRTSRWLLLGLILLMVPLSLSYLLTRSWLPQPGWNQFIELLPGPWSFYQLRPPALVLTLLYGLAINTLIQQRLGLGIPILLATQGLALGALFYESFMHSLDESAFDTHAYAASPGILLALALLWGAHCVELLPLLRRCWRRIRLPLSFSIAIALLGITSWMQQKHLEDIHVSRNIADTGNQLGQLLSLEVQTHLEAMRRFSSFWGMLGHIPSVAQWEQQTSRYSQDFGYFRAIAFIDRDSWVLRLYPYQNNDNVLGVRLFDAQPATHAALERPLIWGVEGQTGVIDLLQGGRGMISYLPVRDPVDGTLFGAIAMVVSLQTLLETILERVDTRNLAISLTANQQQYVRLGPTRQLADWQHDVDIDFGGHTLQLSIRPSLPFLLALRPRLPEITLTCSLVFAYLVYLVLYIYRRLKTQQGALFRANTSLREEVIERSRLQQEIAWLAHHDELTGLPNRRRLMEWAAAEQTRLPLTVMICDIDHFKAVNDSLGHLEGDRYLQRLAQAGRIPVDAAGGLLARYGGEEFVACIPECDAEQALALAEQLRHATYDTGLKQPNGISPVTLSVGIATAAGPPMELEALIQAADEALYRAKANGRNRVERAVSL
ncbi:sensor domain-containing diguanylate cyclase [Halomonas sp. WWR20]